MGGIAGFLERIIGGKASDIGGDLLRLQRTTQQGYDAGVALADEGVAGTRKLGDAYDQMLKSGNSVLPSSTTSVLKRARGAISDRNVRDTMASSARLRQARVASNGRLSAEAAQEYLTEAEAEANRQAGQSALALDSQEAELELSETNTLRDRLAKAREMILGAGFARMQLGQQGGIAALGLRHGRSAAIASTIAATTGGISSGGGGIK